MRILWETINFAQVDKRYFSYDLSDHDPSMPHHAMPEHSKQLAQSATDRFADMPNLVVTQGKIPDVLDLVAPEKIAFMHLDMNNAPAEVAALEVLFDRMVPGAKLVLGMITAGLLTVNKRWPKTLGLRLAATRNCTPAKVW